MASGISGAGACSPAASMQQSRSVDPAKLQQKLLAKLDTNGDQSIDKTELKSFMDFVSTQSSTSSGDTDALFSALDSDSDGSISSTELADNGKALFDQLRDQLRSSQLTASDSPPPPPHGDASDLFSTIDANGDGSIDESELTSFTSQRADSNGQGSQRSAEQGGGMQIGRMIASLLQQYSAVNATASTSTTESLSAVA
jgi:Ca2+-binding EF-hand superfamily protein